jgi:PPOX class probable F420-dependent enzyme
VSTLSMSKAEREAFLAEVHVAVLTVAREPGAPPVAAPVWYGYEPGGDVLISSGRDDEKTRLARENGAASLCAQTEDLPYKFVTVEGPADVRDEPDPDLSRALAYRYLGPELGDAYLEGTAGDVLSIITIRPERWRTTDFAKL